MITTRTFDDRLQTLAHVRDAGINVCSGGILGMGESRRDRASMLRELANLPRHPESVPINLLVQVEGTPLFGADALDPLEFVRTLAVARILMPASYVRLSAGRSGMSDELQALVFSGRGQLHLLRRTPAHHRQPGDRSGPSVVRTARSAAWNSGWRPRSRPPRRRAAGRHELSSNNDQNRERFKARLKPSSPSQGEGTELPSRYTG